MPLLRHRSIRTHLLTLVAACVIPAIAASVFLVFQNYRLQRERTYHDAERVARNLIGDVDGELQGIESGLRVLATSADLERGDLPTFHLRALEALKFQNADNYALTDRSGQQVLNTLRPFGSLLTPSGAAAQLAPVFATRSVVLSDLFQGTLTHRPLIVMAVPVQRRGEVVYTLNASLSPQRLTDILSRQKLPEGWVAALLDSSGTIVARSRDAARYVGQRAVDPLIQASRERREGTLETVTKDGVPVLTAFNRSTMSPWTIAVGAPRQALSAQVDQGLTGVGIGMLVALLVGLWLASSIAARIAHAVRGLIEPALALGSGRPVEMPPQPLRETQAVGQALQRAADMLARAQHLANHDGLTGLCNRMLFDELARRELAAARRYGRALAVLAIDLDGFKEVNDKHGHAAGDLVLKTASDRILSMSRSTDTVARLGGDEFAMLLPGADRDGASRFAATLVEALARPYPGVGTAVSASIGVALLSEAGTTVTTVLKRADGALYDAKRAGKNRVMVWSDTVADAFA
ncbi:diguanylate cyclase [Rhizobacter fulvus]